MGRQQNFYSSSLEQHQHRERGIHPIWRGIGFMMILIIPAISFLASMVLLDENSRQGWFPIPAEFISPYVDPLLYVKIGMTVAITFVLYTITLLITFAMYRAVGPSRYGPLDAPPIKAKIRKRSR